MKTFYQKINAFNAKNMYEINKENLRKAVESAMKGAKANPDKALRQIVLDQFPNHGREYEMLRRQRSTHALHTGDETYANTSNEIDFLLGYIDIVTACAQAVKRDYQPSFKLGFTADQTKALLTDMFNVYTRRDEARADLLHGSGILDCMQDIEFSKRNPDTGEIRNYATEEPRIQGNIRETYMRKEILKAEMKQRNFLWRWFSKSARQMRKFINEAEKALKAVNIPQEAIEQAKQDADAPAVRADDLKMTDRAIDFLYKQNVEKEMLAIKNSMLTLNYRPNPAKINDHLKAALEMETFLAEENKMLPPDVKDVLAMNCDKVQFVARARKGKISAAEADRRCNQVQRAMEEKRPDYKPMTLADVEEREKQRKEETRRVISELQGEAQKLVESKEKAKANEQIAKPTVVEAPKAEEQPKVEESPKEIKQATQNKPKRYDQLVMEQHISNEFIMEAQPAEEKKIEEPVVVENKTEETVVEEPVVEEPVNKPEETVVEEPVVEEPVNEPEETVVEEPVNEPEETVVEETVAEETEPMKLSEKDNAFLHTVNRQKGKVPKKAAPVAKIFLEGQELNNENVIAEESEDEFDVEDEVELHNEPEYDDTLELDESPIDDAPEEVDEETQRKNLEELRKMVAAIRKESKEKVAEAQKKAKAAERQRRPAEMQKHNERRFEELKILNIPSKEFGRSKFKSSISKYPLSGLDDALDNALSNDDLTEKVIAEITDIFRNGKLCDEEILEDNVEAFFNLTSQIQGQYEGTDNNMTKYVWNMYQTVSVFLDDPDYAINKFHDPETQIIQTQKLTDVLLRNYPPLSDSKKLVDQYARNYVIHNTSLLEQALRDLNVTDKVEIYGARLTGVGVSGARNDNAYKGGALINSIRHKVAMEERAQEIANTPESEMSGPMREQMVILELSEKIGDKNVSGKVEEQEAPVKGNVRE